MTARAYEEFAPYVRRTLSQWGVAPADLPDVCHEVFLVVHTQSEKLDGVERFDLWLREICRRVASGYRRRAFRRRELPMEGSLEQSMMLVENDEVEAAEQQGRLSRALTHLDEESRDLLALHDVGEMPLTELAKLVLRDRKTVRKRLELARRRLTAELRADEANRTGSSARRSVPVAPPASGSIPVDPERLLRDFEVLSVTSGILIAMLGNVMVTVWSGVASEEAFDQLSYHGMRTIPRCGKIGYLAIVEPTVRPPPFAARRKIVECLERFGPHVIKYATVILGGGAWIVRPIMSGLLVLARPRFPMRFFDGIEPAVEWLCDRCGEGPSGPLAQAELMLAAERLRGIARTESKWNAAPAG